MISSLAACRIICKLLASSFVCDAILEINAQRESGHRPIPRTARLRGIQEAGRLTAAAVEEIATGNESFRNFLSLNDPPGSQAFRVGERNFAFRGFGRAKLQFVLSAVDQARRFGRSGAGIVLALHPHLALPASLMKVVAPHLKTIVMSHGVEVWEPMTALRNRALLNADLVIAPSRHTALKLAEVQHILRRESEFSPGR